MVIPFPNLFNSLSSSLSVQHNDHFLHLSMQRVGGKETDPTFSISLISSVPKPILSPSLFEHTLLNNCIPPPSTDSSHFPTLQLQNLASELSLLSTSSFCTTSDQTSPKSEVTVSSLLPVFSPLASSAYSGHLS